jgi:hypothetical protein
MSSGLYNVAVACLARGWPVFPIIPGGKLPAIPTAHPGERETRCRGECSRFGHGVYDATTDAATVGRWWEHCPHANAGLACGPSGLVVVDLDVPKHVDDRPPARWRTPGVNCGADVLAAICEQAGEHLPTETLTVGTPSGGIHLYFRAPEGAEVGNSSGRLGWKIDTRGVGGYVLAAGSLVAGRPYTVMHEADPAPLPAWLAQRLTAEQNRPRVDAGQLLAHTPVRSSYVEAALRSEVQAVLDARDGNRNNTLNTAAVKLSRFVVAGTLPAPLVEEALTAAGQAAGLPVRECLGTIRSGLRAGARNPRSAA